MSISSTPRPDSPPTSPPAPRTGPSTGSGTSSTDAVAPSSAAASFASAPPTAGLPADPAGRPRPSWRSVLVFSAVAYGVLALFAAPFWVLEEGIAHPLFTLLIGVGMLAPTVATVVVAKFVDRTSWRDAVGLRFRGRWRRILLWAPLALLVMFGINAATAVLMVLRGVPGDLTGGTWAAELTRSMAAEGIVMPTGAAIAMVLGISLVGVLLTALPALGEEIGWRGWLRRELAPLGTWASIVLGGVIWSLWHLPVVLIGYNYSGEPRWAAVLMFLPACIALNFLFSAITERAGGNPIPAAFAHATLNSSLGLALAVVSTSGTMSELNWFLDTPLGLIGIVLTTGAAWAIMPRRRHGAEQAARAGAAQAAA